MKLRILVCLLLVCSALVACANEEPLIEYDGRLLTREELEALVSASLETEETPTVTLVRFGESEVEEDLRVYWSKSGSVWHASPTCSHLSKSNAVYYGTLDEAKSAGKSRCCATCSEDIN